MSHEDLNLGANFISKMSKVFKEVGRVDKCIKCNPFIIDNPIHSLENLLRNKFVTMTGGRQSPGKSFNIPSYSDEGL